MYYTTDELIHFGGIMLAALLAYIFFWKKNRPLAVVILVSLIGYLAYHVVDWPYFQKYFFVDWGGGGIAGTSATPR